MPDRQWSAGIINHRNALARQRPRNPGWFQNKQHLVLLQCQVHRDGVLFPPGKGIVEVVRSVHSSIRCYDTTQPVAEKRSTVVTRPARDFLKAV
jgi:hypothetical protein